MEVVVPEQELTRKADPGDAVADASPTASYILQAGSFRNAADAEQRMVFLKNRLAEYENFVADYYLRRGAYVAAANRAKFALEAYNGAESNAESLNILIAAYEELGMEDLAADAAAAAIPHVAPGEPAPASAQADLGQLAGLVGREVVQEDRLDVAGQRAGQVRRQGGPHRPPRRLQRPDTGWYAGRC